MSKTLWCCFEPMKEGLNRFEKWLVWSIEDVLKDDSFWVTRLYKFKCGYSLLFSFVIDETFWLMTQDRHNSFRIKVDLVDSDNKHIENVEDIKDRSLSLAIRRVRNEIQCENIMRNVENISTELETLISILVSFE